MQTTQLDAIGVGPPWVLLNLAEDADDVRALRRIDLPKLVQEMRSCRDGRQGAPQPADSSASSSSMDPVNVAGAAARRSSSSASFQRRA